MFLKIKFKPLLYALSFFASLELVLNYNAWLLWIWLVMAAAFLFQKWHFFLGSALFLLAAMFSVLLFPVGYQAQILILLTSAAFYLYLVQESRKSVFVLMSFLVICGTMGITAKYLTFALPGFADWWLFLVIFLAVSVLTYVGIKNSLEAHGFSLISDEGETLARKTWKDALFSGVVIGELAVAINFLPLNFLTAGAIIWVIYLTVYDLLKRDLYSALTKKVIIQKLVVSGLLLAIILATTQWQLI